MTGEERRSEENPYAPAGARLRMHPELGRSPELGARVGMALLTSIFGALPLASLAGFTASITNGVVVGMMATLFLGLCSAMLFWSVAMIPYVLLADPKGPSSRVARLAIYGALVGLLVTPILQVPLLLAPLVVGSGALMASAYGIWLQRWLRLRGYSDAPSPA